MNIIRDCCGQEHVRHKYLLEPPSYYFKCVICGRYVLEDSPHKALDAWNVEIEATIKYKLTGILKDFNQSLQESILSAPIESKQVLDVYDDFMRHAHTCEREIFHILFNDGDKPRV